MSEMVERVAIEMRRNRFKRTRRTVFDEAVLPTETELDDASAAISAMAEPNERALIIAAAAEAKCDGRDFSALGAADKKRYVERLAVTLAAYFAALSKADPHPTTTMRTPL